MRFIRAVIFNTLFYMTLVLAMLLFLPLLLWPRRHTKYALKLLIRIESILQRIFGIKTEIRGYENIPPGGCLVAAKHQSLWETFMLQPLFSDPVFIYKRELGRLPLFGTFLRKMTMIAIDRNKGARTLREMSRATIAAIQHDRQVIIFPEGTRRALASEAEYKTGIAFLYTMSGAPVVPVAHNSGLLWSGYFWRGKPGTISVEILPMIEPGLSRGEFLSRLQNELETASSALPRMHMH